MKLIITWPNLLYNFSLGHPCPNNYNPADFYVQTLAIEPKKERQCRKTIKTICDSFAVSSLARTNDNVTSIENLQGMIDSSKNLKVGYRATWLMVSWMTICHDLLCVLRKIYQYSHQLLAHTLLSRNFHEGFSSSKFSYIVTLSTHGIWLWHHSWL